MFIWSGIASENIESIQQCDGSICNMSVYSRNKVLTDLSARCLTEQGRKADSPALEVMFTGVSMNCGGWGVRRPHHNWDSDSKPPIPTEKEKKTWSVSQLKWD